MIKRRYLSFPLLFCILLAFFTYWLDQTIQPLITAEDNGIYHHPDYIIENISGIRMDHESMARRAYFAKKLLYYHDQNMTHLEQIRFINTEPDKPLMRLRADEAKLSGKGKNIYLSGNVAVLRGNNDDEDKITMLTNSLHLTPDEDTAKTVDPVVISRLDTTIHAVGLELDNQNGKIQLLLRVRAVNH